MELLRGLMLAAALGLMLVAALVLTMGIELVAHWADKRDVMTDMLRVETKDVTLGDRWGSKLVLK